MLLIIYGQLETPGRRRYLTMNKAIWTALLAGAVACGASDEQQYAEIELGTAEQDLSVGTGSGFSTATSRAACTFPGPSGQDCRVYVPNTLTVGYCFSGLSTTEKNELKAGIAIVDGATSFTFAETSFPCTLSMQKGAVSGSTSNIDGFLNFGPTGTLTNLTSPAGSGHLNGTWKAFTSGTVVVDATKAFNQGAFERPNLMKHMGGAAALRMLGQGSQTLDTTYANSPGRRHWLSVLTNPVTGVTSGEACRMNAINNSAPANQISANTTCGQ